MNGLIKPAWIESEKLYLEGVLPVTPVSTIEEALLVASQTVDGLKKGWHFDSLEEVGEGTYIMHVVKRE